MSGDQQSRAAIAGGIALAAYFIVMAFIIARVFGL